MKTILIAKGGGVFKTRDHAKGNAVGEQGETEGVIRHLMKRNDIRLVYFGQYYGEQLTHELVEPCLDGLQEFATAEQQEENWAKDVKALQHYDPVAFLHVSGYAPTFSWIRNPKGAIVQCAPMRYTGPMLNAIQQLKLPRLVINNDPRCYPKDQEMTYGWEYCRPQAILDQCDSKVQRKVGGIYYTCTTTYAAAESWAYLPKQPERERYADCSIIAHAHIRDGCKERDRDTAWRNILDGAPAYPVYGKGWQHFSGKANYCGVLRPEEVLDTFSISRYTVAVSPNDKFYSGKPFVAWSCGCMPLFYGTKHQKYCWDPYEYYLPMNHPCRIQMPGDLKRIVESDAGADVDWDKVLAPNYEMLDRLIDDIVNEVPLNGRYGGYRL